VGKFIAIMTTLRFNLIGAACGVISTVGTALSRQGHIVCGLTLAIAAAAVSVTACVRWFRTRSLRDHPCVERP
jgi:hypothetical protein